MDLGIAVQTKELPNIAMFDSRHQIFRILKEFRDRFIEELKLWKEEKYPTIIKQKTLATLDL